MSTAVAIGVFDGVHLGHQALLRRTIETSREFGLNPAVLTFDPHPAAVVAPGREPRLLTTVEERCRLIREQGIDKILVLPFDKKIAAMTPEQFAQDILRGQLDAKAIIVGEGFNFGRDRVGSVETLAGLGFVTRPLVPVKYRGVVVSSTQIRKCIESGDVSLAGRLLDRPYEIFGDIVSGHGIGSKQTVPTLNLKTNSEVLPANGVYITRTNHRWNSITNVGNRPTFENDGAISIETFILSPFKEPSPKSMTLEFLRRVRDERKFDSPDALKAQILRDVKTANTYFRRTNKTHGNSICGQN
jgi:riboflavin kinase/FMN adenylyltransferase